MEALALAVAVFVCLGWAFVAWALVAGGNRTKDETESDQ